MFKQVLKFFLAVAFAVTAMSVQATTTIRVSCSYRNPTHLAKTGSLSKKLSRKNPEEN